MSNLPDSEKEQREKWMEFYDRDMVLNCGVDDILEFVPEEKEAEADTVE